MKENRVYTMAFPFSIAKEFEIQKRTSCRPSADGSASHRTFSLAMSQTCLLQTYPMLPSRVLQIHKARCKIKG
jgi:hypothetical protein